MQQVDIIISCNLSRQNCLDAIGKECLAKVDAYRANLLATEASTLTVMQFFLICIKLCDRNCTYESFMCSWVDSRTPTNYAEIFVKSIWVQDMSLSVRVGGKERGSILNK